jgi:cell division protein ZapA (FtsZ GTPase activity inhibitor)
MSKVQTIDVIIFETKLTLFTNELNETQSTATELDEYLKNLQKKFPDAKQNVILLYACLKQLMTNKKLAEENEKLNSEREELSKALQGFFV